MTNQDLQKESFNNSGEEKVAALLGSLDRVDPPGNFDMRVRARIAQGRPAAPKASWFPIMARIAAPAAVIAMAGGYFGYNALYREGNVNVPTVAETRQAPQAPTITQPTVETPVPQVSAQTPEVAAARPPVNTAESVATNSKKPAVNKPAEAPAGGSVDLAAREANSVSGSNSDAVKAKLSVREVFSAIGVRASQSGSGWRVSSASGAAAAAGLKAGDIIESINGQSVGANTVFDANFVGRTLRIKRDGASLTIGL